MDLGCRDLNHACAAFLRVVGKALHMTSSETWRRSIHVLLDLRFGRKDHIKAFKNWEAVLPSRWPRITGSPNQDCYDCFEDVGVLKPRSESAIFGVLPDSASLRNPLGKIDLARRIFHRMEVRDVISWTAILDMYVEMGDLTEARRVFDEMPVRNTVSWSAMIARYGQSGYTEEAVKLFYRMIQDGFSPNTSCLASVISAMACLEALHAGMNIHARLVKTGVEGDSHLAQALPKKQWKDLA
ncbi:hypothetical protein RJ639_003161 [Escallonia herrerae]|uniref:Pentatricopeptide repeat-containing protein n=1 Tax=Escallonia herrerae TaxID=1293975 RepID=A0AA89AY09_9ASTE|nr:hypothetical protein RJ639_003161 [Escallonia herrerae]